MKDTQQVHYEQTGNFVGSIELDGKRYSLNLRASRDPLLRLAQLAHLGPALLVHRNF